ncbi:MULTISPECIES: hypothetical protein [Stutzerimonas stutzeri subgroup]|uniref:hypothetical protein n=1 Tax=Stutzerimonas stutzeri subgroup TaxID=578833 RepID=UPI00155926B9|nr:hypothetical protein [Stutzerimonas stutzeri]MCQ2048274.1 diheme cytochrome c [Stutzerimonas kunmingensis]QQC12435.1 diheme cytochrome c [Stutzerimonas stutzeri]
MWKEECAACHMLYSPGLLPADAWREQMRTLGDHYGSNASLDPVQEKEILDFLVRASAANRLPVEPSPTVGEQPRISQTRWFERKHDEVSEAKFKRESVGGRANCVACHRDAESGDFDEDRVRSRVEPPDPTEVIRDDFHSARRPRGPPTAADRSVAERARAARRPPAAEAGELPRQPECVGRTDVAARSVAVIQANAANLRRSPPTR